MIRTIVTEDVVRSAARRGLPIRVGEDDVVSAGARSLAAELGVRIEAGPGEVEGSAPSGARIVAIGADHGGYPLKSELKRRIEAMGYAVRDLGCHSIEAVDYPDYARAVAEAVAREGAWRGIMIDGAGIGSAMVANKVPGVRASLCYDLSSARNAREHNDANVLTLGGALIGSSLAAQIVEVWLATAFGEGRHARRVAKIDALDALRRH